MERKRMDQTQLAEALGVSRSAVNAWINDRAYPMNSIGALEDLLEVDLTGDKNANAEPDPNEAVLQNSIDGLDPAQREELVQAYRAIRNGGPPGSPRRERAG